MSGKLPAGWEEKKLGDVLTIERGGSPRPIEKYITNSPDGINWVKISDATASDRYIYETKEKITREGLKKTRIVNEGDFILSNSMSFGRPYIMKTSGCIHDGWLVLKQNGRTIFEQEFLYYLLSAPLVFAQFDYLAAGSTVRNLNIALVSSVKVPIPPLPEQKRIVAILDEAFSDIAKTKENAEKSQADAREIFGSYLEEVFRKGSRGDAENVEWEERKLGDIVINITDGDHMPPPKANKGIPFVTISNINKHTNDIDFSDTFFVPASYYENLKEIKKPRKGDVLYTVTGSYGVPVLIQDKKEFCFQRHIGLIRPKEDKLESKLLFYWILTAQAKSFADACATGTAQKTVSLNSLRNFRIPLPPLPTQRRIVSRLDALSAETKRLEAIYRQKIADLNELKKSILQKAFSGEL